MDRITKFDTIRGCYVIDPNAVGNHVQRLGVYEDRDTEKEVGIRDGLPICPSCGDILEEVPHYCANCGQRVKWEKEIR